MSVATDFRKTWVLPIHKLIRRAHHATAFGNCGGCGLFPSKTETACLLAWTRGELDRSDIAYWVAVQDIVADGQPNDSGEDDLRVMCSGRVVNGNVLQEPVDSAGSKFTGS